VCGHGTRVIPAVAAQNLRKMRNRHVEWAHNQVAPPGWAKLAPV
jgi:hypothetical protein